MEHTCPCCYPPLLELCQEFVDEFRVLLAGPRFVERLPAGKVLTGRIYLADTLARRRRPSKRCKEDPARALHPPPNDWILLPYTNN